jgi:hypothetical protein
MSYVLYQIRHAQATPRKIGAGFGGEQYGIIAFSAHFAAKVQNMAIS